MGLAIGLLLAEVGLRVVRTPLVRLDRRPAVYQLDPDLGFRYIPNSSDYIERLDFRTPIHLNSSGFYDDPFPTPGIPPPPGSTRIAAIGDSFTVGWQAGRGKNFPDILEQQLNESDAAGCPCEVLNFGLSGTGTVQQALIFEQFVLEYQPDVVLVAFYRNDVEDVAYGIVYQEVYRDYVLSYSDESQRQSLIREVDDLLGGGGAALRAAIQRSYVVRAVYNTWLQQQGEPSPNLRDNRIYAKRERKTSNKRARRNIVASTARIDETCQEIGCELVFVVIPSREEVDATESPLHQPIVEELDLLGVRTLVLLESFQQHHAQGEQLFWPHDAHATQAGYQLIADEIAAYLRQESLLAN